MLHITNGDAACAVLDLAVQGAIMAWRDVLHEGPVHAGLPLQDLSQLRVDFIAAAGWAPRAQVQRQFVERDAALAGCGRHEEVVLWFEHDLYDQLQLIQLLDWFGTHPHPRLTLVCEAEYLGNMRPERAAALYSSRKAVSSGMLADGSSAWQAFACAEPAKISLAPRSELPFLAAALRRHLEEFPWTSDGLSRLERQALLALSGGPLDLRTLYRRAHHEQEEPVWLGDSLFAWHLSRLAQDGFVHERDATWHLSERANHVLSGNADAWTGHRQPRWLGGFLMKYGRPRWDAGQRGLCRSDNTAGST